MSVLVHKAVEPDNLGGPGKRRFATLVEALIYGDTSAAWVQPKFDGVYAQLVFDQLVGWQAWSRTGQHLKSVGTPILDVLSAKGLTERRYIGELWLPGEAHSTINGRARKQTPQHLELRLFDSFDPRGDETYRDRYDYLFEGGPVVPVQNLNLVGKINVLDDLYDTARDLKNRGASAYDGLILRDPEGIFVDGPGKGGETIKIKPRAEGDFRVVGTTRGVGNRAGGVGALVVDLGGRTCEVGTGLTQADVFGEDPTGRIATVEYLGVTKNGLLREPSFKTFRFDKTEADTLDAGGGDD